MEAESSTDLDQVFRESREDLSRYFARRHKDPEQARDLVQDAFAEMARSIGHGRRPRSHRAYLFGIARKLSVSAWKRRDREREAMAAMPEPVVTSEVEDSRLADAREAIAGLPPLHREILDLRFTQNLSYSEIAKVLDIPLGTVRSRIHHAVRAVRRQLNESSPPTGNQP